jgi:hypothetical protein
MPAKLVPFSPDPQLTQAFVESRLRLGWADLAWLVVNLWLPAAQTIELADQLAETEPDLRAEIALAATDRVALRAILDRQATRHGPPEEEVRERWMQLAVTSLYEHRAEVTDPWPILEQIWEAFDHAPALNGLIRWMPVAPSDKVGMDAMLERWRTYAQGSWR